MEVLSPLATEIVEEIKELEQHSVSQEEFEQKMAESEKTEPNPLDPREIKKMQAMFGNAKTQLAKYLLNEDGKKLVLNESNLNKDATILFKNCINGYYEIDSPCTKILIESCNGTTIVLGDKILTSTVDIYKCDNFSLQCNVKLGTLQADMCKKLMVQFKNKELITQLVWAGVYDLDVKFEENPELNLSTGLDVMKKRYPDVRETIDQFSVRHIKNQVICERIIRLDNGFPTTSREKKIYDDRQEEAIQRLAKESGITIGRKPEKKIPPNSICPKCKSGDRKSVV